MEKKVTIREGVEMPILSFGLGTKWLSISPEREGEMKEAIKTALEKGFRHIDSAEFYQNEKVTGEAIAEYLFSHPSLSRSDLFITSKIWNGKKKEEVRKTLEKTLKDLQVDYLDLYLIHSPFNLEISLSDLWDEMQSLLSDQLVRAIGVSNFQIEDLEEIKNAPIKVALNQIEFHPYLQQENLLHYCRQNNIIVSSYGGLVPYNRFELNNNLNNININNNNENNNNNNTEENKNNNLKNNNNNNNNNNNDNDNDNENKLNNLNNINKEFLKLLNELAEKYSLSVAGILQKWIVFNDVAVVTTSASEKHLNEFINAFVEKNVVCKSDFEKISEISKGIRFRKFWQKEFTIRNMQ